jgi:nitroimidazol reductase NimA-like FMN-containing flavoprotein (pyridoxamine 5'-phosphate oxidase superfamily)
VTDDSQRPDLDAVARAILDANHYMTLGTADLDGRPRVSPVFFAAAPGYRELYWISSPEATHLYRDTASQHWVLDPGVAPDQRTTVSP